MSEQNRQEEAARNDRQRLEQQAVESHTAYNTQPIVIGYASYPSEP